MGRNRKGRQCGGFGSKLERFVLQRRWQNEAAKVAKQSSISRQAQRRQQQQQERENERSNAFASSLKRRARVDVVKALMNARQNDDQIERIKQESVQRIASELQSDSVAQPLTSLQERCLYEIARTFDLYDSSCEFTQACFETFEPWMVTRLAEMATALKTMSDSNVSLLLLQPTDQLTIGFVRSEKSLTRLFRQEDDSAHAHVAWSLNSLMQQEVESWDELSIDDDVDIVATREEVHLRSLRLVSCAGLSLSFLTQLVQDHPYLESFVITDCFDSLGSSSEDRIEGLQQIAHCRSLKTLRFSWCCWLTTECLATFAYQLSEPAAAQLEELHVSNCFDVVEDYIRLLFSDLHPAIRLTF